MIASISPKIGLKGILGSCGAFGSSISVGIIISSALETSTTPAILAATANKRIVLNRSMPNRLPSAKVKRPLRLLRIVTLLTEVWASAILIVTLAANLLNIRESAKCNLIDLGERR
jgi:hypothetical protein